MKSTVKAAIASEGSRRLIFYAVAAIIILIIAYLIYRAIYSAFNFAEVKAQQTTKNENDQLAQLEAELSKLNTGSAPSTSQQVADMLLNYSTASQAENAISSSTKQAIIEQSGMTANGISSNLIESVFGNPTSKSPETVFVSGHPTTLGNLLQFPNFTAAVSNFINGTRTTGVQH